MGTGLQQDAGDCNSPAETGESQQTQHRLWVYVPESVFSAQLFPAAPEPLPDTAHMILDRKLQNEKISTLELSNAARFVTVYVCSNITVRGKPSRKRQTKPK